MAPFTWADAAALAQAVAREAEQRRTADVDREAALHAAGQPVTVDDLLADDDALRAIIDALAWISDTDTSDIAAALLDAVQVVEGKRGRTTTGPVVVDEAYQLTPDQLAQAARPLHPLGWSVPTHQPRPGTGWPYAAGQARPVDDGETHSYGDGCPGGHQ